MKTVIAILMATAVFAVAGPETDYEYIVPDFVGGLNVATDSTDLRANQALELTNLLPGEMPNVLTNRQGYSFWNDSLISDNEIQQIFVYEPYADTQRLVFACNGFLYFNTNLTDPGTVDWDTLRFKIDVDSAIFTNASKFVRGINRQFFVRFTGAGDVVQDENDATYTVDYTNVGYVNGVWLTANYTGTTDTFACELIKKIAGNPYFAQYHGNLYISDSESFPLVYNDTSLNFLAVVDTGTVLDTTSASDSVAVYSFSQVHVAGRLVHVRNSANMNFITGGVAAGDIFTYYLSQRGWAGENRMDQYETVIDVVFTAIADSVDSFAVLLDRVMQYTPVDYYNNYSFRRELYPCALSDTQTVVIDTSKEWWDTQYGDTYLTNFYAVGESSGVHGNFKIYCNSETTFTAEKTRRAVSGYFGDGHRYTIFSRIPFDADTLLLDQYIEFPRFSKTVFYRNQLFAIGYDQITEGTWESCCNLGKNEKANRSRVWYSEILIPYFIKYNYSLDVSSNSGTTNLFELRDGLYISDNNSIWRFAGRPRLGGSNGDGLTTKMVFNNGIPDIDNWAKSTEEYGYFTNRTGIYRFDGVRPEKISYTVDPIIEKNYASRIVMVYQNPMLYVSFADSNFTLAYDERFNMFTKLNFGMTCAYAPPDTDIIYFGLKGHTGRIYYYPNGEYWDHNSPTDSAAIPIQYKSGWQTYAGYWLNKKVKSGHFPMLSPDTATIYMRSNFNATPVDTVSADSSGRFVYNEYFTDVVGEYHQVNIIDTVTSQIIIGGYRLVWEKLPEYPK